MAGTQTRLSTEERQAEIVAAALSLARESSPALVTTGDIAEAIGVTQGAVFKHFASKDAIWLAAMRWVRGELLGRIEQSAAQASSPTEALAAIFTAHVEFVVQFPGVPRLIFHELQQAADSLAKTEVRQLLQSYRRLLLETLERAAGAGEVAADLDKEAAATAFVGLIQGLVMQAMLAGRPSAMRSQGERLFVLYLRGIGVSR